MSEKTNQPKPTYDSDTTDARRGGPADRRLGRRPFLRGAAASAVALGGVGASGVAAAQEGQYDRVVDIVEDYGADPTGEEPINDALEGAVRDDTMVVFPEGRYWVADGGFYRWRDTSVSNVALVGEGDVTVAPTPGTNPYIFVLWGADLRLENFTFDQTAANTSVGVALRSDGDLVMRDVLFDGVGDTHGPFNILPGVTDPNASGLIENVHCPDGTAPGYRKGGCWVYNGHAGELVFRRCSFENFSDNAIYASGAGHPDRGRNGAVGVENCFFRNNNVSSIRLGTPGSYAKNCTVVVDDADGGPPELPWGAVTARAAWLWYDFDGVVENLDVFVDHPRGRGVFFQKSQHDSASVKNVRMELNADDATGLRALVPGDDLSFENVSVTGDAGEGAAAWFANRNVTLRNCCIHQTGANRAGIDFDDSDSAVLESAIDVTGEAVDADAESDVTVRNLREEGGCPVPNRTHPAETE